MGIHWKLRERLTVMYIGVGIIPVLLAVSYVGIVTGRIIEKQAINYMQVRVDDFAKMAEIRSVALQGNLDIIREQLEKSLKSDLINEASKEKYFKTGYLVIVAPDGTTIYHPKAELRGNKYLYNTYDWARNAVNKRHGLFRYSLNGEDKISYLAEIKSLNWILWAGVPQEEVLSELTMVKYYIYGFIVVVLIIIGVLGVAISGRIAKRAKEISNRMENIAQGDADLTVRLPVVSSDEIGDIAAWFNKFIENLEGVITTVKESAHQVDVATREVSSGSQGLSQATQEQAAAIEEVAATIEEMTSSIKQNASNASEGREKAQVMVQMANASGEASRELVTGMGEISEASRKIGDIIITVNEVAFQTNLLALNAAVEAARAGEHGKGFAVVAEEVRALAQRSAEASKQIKTLIEDTVRKISAGDDMVKKSRESLEKIITYIENLSQTMDEIAAASSEQAGGVDELNRAIAQIDSTTQQNASTVEELASTSDSLSTEARDLAGTVERFKVAREQRAAGMMKKEVKPVIKKQGIKPVKRPAAVEPVVRIAKEESKPSSMDSLDSFEEF